MLMFSGYSPLACGTPGTVTVGWTVGSCTVAWPFCRVMLAVMSGPQTRPGTVMSPQLMVRRSMVMGTVAFAVVGMVGAAAAGMVVTAAFVVPVTAVAAWAFGELAAVEAPLHALRARE